MKLVCFPIPNSVNFVNFSLVSEAIETCKVVLFIDALVAGIYSTLHDTFRPAIQAHIETTRFAGLQVANGAKSTASIAVFWGTLLPLFHGTFFGGLPGFFGWGRFAKGLNQEHLLAVFFTNGMIWLCFFVLLSALEGDGLATFVARFRRLSDFLFMVTSAFSFKNMTKMRGF